MTHQTTKFFWKKWLALVSRHQYLNSLTHQTELSVFLWNYLFSENGILICSVPKGSILGPLLFLIYINDLPQFLSESGSYLYADDTYIFSQDKEVHKFEDVLNNKNSQHSENGLLIKSYQFILEPIKKNAFCFSKTKPSANLNISYGNHDIKQAHLWRTFLQGTLLWRTLPLWTFPGTCTSLKDISLTRHTFSIFIRLLISFVGIN